MTFQCSGTSYCLDSDTATVVFNLIEKKISSTIKIQKAPICIVTEAITVENQTGGKCFKFSGKDIYDINSFELFACGQNPTFVTVEDGIAIYIDGVRLGGDDYRYKSGTGTVVQVSKVIRSSQVYSSGGGCPCLESTATKVTITDKNNSPVYQKVFEENPEIKVSCDGCPPNHIKCEHPRYPGYCCLPCKETANKINQVANKIR